MTPPILHTHYNNTKNIFTYETDTKYSSKIERLKDQTKAKYHLPEFLRENEKSNIQECSTLSNTVARTSEDVDLPHKRYCRK